MQRRKYLAAAASTALLPTSGCLSALRGPTSLGSAEAELDADGMEKHLTFTRDSEDQTTITINQRRRPQSPDEQVPFRFHVWHREGLSIDRLYYKLRAPPRSTGVPAEVFLQVPHGGPWPPFNLRKEDNHWTVISIDEIGGLGDGSLTLDLILDPVSEPVEELAVRIEVDFSASGVFEAQYRAATNTQFDILPALN